MIPELYIQYFVIFVILLLMLYLFHNVYGILLIMFMGIYFIIYIINNCLSTEMDGLYILILAGVVIYGGIKINNLRWGNRL